MAGCVMVLAAGLIVPAGPGWAVGPMVSLSPKAGPPGSTVRVTGTGFGSAESVDVYFDTADETVAVTDNFGAFIVSIPVASSATPGTHLVIGQGQGSGLSAQAPFEVGASWAQF
jgi:hypothetical protein